MRFACVLIEQLPLKVETLLTPALAQQALAVLRAWDELVLNVSSQAMAAGVGPGGTRRRVSSSVPRQPSCQPERHSARRATKH